MTPAGPSISILVPSAAAASVRLKALARMRVAIMSSGSCGAEAMVNARVGPEASSSGGLMSVNIAFWPASWVNPAGLSK